MDENKSMFYIVSIIAIVAIVGLVVLIVNATAGGRVVYANAPLLNAESSIENMALESEDAAGQAMRIVGDGEEDRVRIVGNDCRVVNERKCVSNTVFKVCNNNHKWSGTRFCDAPNGEICKNGACVFSEERRVNCGDTISKNLTLVEDLNCSNIRPGYAALTLNDTRGNWVTLDCNNHIITGEKIAGYIGSIGVTASYGAIIKNCNIQNFNQGIRLSGGGIYVINNNIEKNGFGIFLTSTTRSHKLFNNTIINNDGPGLVLEYARDNLISSNTICDNGRYDIDSIGYTQNNYSNNVCDSVYNQMNLSLNTMCGFRC